MNEQEETIISQLKEGNEKAYRYLFDHYYVLLCRVANFYVGDAFVAENLVEDLISYLWEKRASLKIRTSLRAYLYTAIRHRSLNYLKQANVTRETNLSVFADDAADFVFPVSESTTLVSLIEKELDEKISACVARLPDESRVIFCMSRYDNMTYKAIADRQGISINTVRYHIKNALATLRKNLREYLLVLLIVILSLPIY